jgi:hypothetical protein
MKKILFFGVLLSIASILFAQRQMYVWQNGTPTIFAVAEVDSITFGDCINAMDTLSDAKLTEMLCKIWYDTLEAWDKLPYPYDTLIYEEDTPDFELTFQDNGVLKYCLGIPDLWIGTYIDFQYYVSEGKLFIYADPTINSVHAPETSFEFSTDFSVNDSILLINQFSHNGTIFYPLVMRNAYYY